MLKFSICGVDNSGVEAVLANPLPGTNLGSLVGSVVKLGGKVVGKVSRIYRDATGPFVMKADINDIPALRLSATGCLSAVTIGSDGVELRDFVADHGQIFAHKSASGDVLQKRFIGLPDQTLQLHLAKVAAGCDSDVKHTTDLRKNQSAAIIFHKGKVVTPDTREVRDSRFNWPNQSTPQIGVARVQLPNRNSRA